MVIGEHDTFSPSTSTVLLVQYMCHRQQNPDVLHDDDPSSHTVTMVQRALTAL